MSYLPIEEHGIIGNLHTTALVGKNGSIDWFCFPRFDSPSIFGAILDDVKGGYFRIFPVAGDLTVKQVYWPDTNILVTRFLAADGVGEVIDFMPMCTKNEGEDGGRLIRRVRVLRGSMRFRLECYPAFDYAREGHTTRLVSHGAHFHSSRLHLELTARIRLQHCGAGVCAEFSLQEGKRRSFSLGQSGSRAGSGKALTEAECEEIFQETILFWQHWLSRSNYHGR